MSRAKVDAVSARAVVVEMTPQNVEVKKPEAIAKIDNAMEHLTVAETQLAVASKSAAQNESTIGKQEKQIEKLKANDPVTTWLNLIGIGAIVLGAGTVIATFFVAAFSAAWIRSAAVGGIAFGFLLVTIAHFMTAIYWISAGVLVAGLISAGIWWYTHRTICTHRSKKAAKVASPIVVKPLEVKP